MPRIKSLLSWFVLSSLSFSLDKARVCIDLFLSCVRSNCGAGGCESILSGVTVCCLVVLHCYSQVCYIMFMYYCQHLRNFPFIKLNFSSYQLLYINCALSLSETVSSNLAALLFFAMGLTHLFRSATFANQIEWVRFKSAHLVDKACEIFCQTISCHSIPYFCTALLC